MFQQLNFWWLLLYYNALFYSVCSYAMVVVGVINRSASVRRLQLTVLECTPPPALVCKGVGAICLVTATTDAGQCQICSSSFWVLPSSSRNRTATTVCVTFHHCPTRIYNYWKSDDEELSDEFEFWSFTPENPDSLFGSRELLRPLTPHRMEGSGSYILSHKWMVGQKSCCFIIQI